MIKVLPLKGEVWVEVEDIKKTKGGILLTTRNDAKVERGVVKGIADDITQVKVGDTILFKLYSVSVIEIDGEEFAFIHEDEILAIQK